MFSIGSVKADEKLINFSCDYQFEGIELRVRVKDLEQKYVKDSQQIDTSDSTFLDSHNFWYYKNNNGEWEVYKSSWFDSGTDEYKGYKNKKLIFNISEKDKKEFLMNATNGGKINCPQLYYYSNDSFNENNPYIVSPFSTHSENNGGLVNHEGNMTITFTSKNCYKNGTDTSYTKCEEVETGELYSDDKLECVYSSNKESKQFKLIYDKKQDKLYFDSLGASYAITEGMLEKEGNNILVIEEGMRSNFKGSKTCPKRISCYCYVGTWSNECYFNKGGAYDNAKCGQLQSENGDESAGLNSSGGSPDSPDGWRLSDEDMTCEELLGTNLTKVVNVAVTAVRVVGALAMIIFGIITYIPVISGDDPEMLKKANSKVIKMGIVLIVILLLPTLIKVLGNIFDFDLTCLV